MNKPLKSFSTGQKNQFEVILALSQGAEYILMDEPFASLDYDMKCRIAPQVFSKLSGKTIIVVSHDISEAQAYANKIITI